MGIKVIELVGLPGCGKSTLCKELYSQLKETSNILVLKRSDISSQIDIMWKYRWTIPLFVIYDIFTFSHFNLSFNLIKFVSSYKFNNLSIIYAIYILKVSKFIYKNKNKNIILLLDEGIVQFLSSIAHSVNIRMDKTIKNIFYNIKNISYITTYVNCNLPIDVVIQRIKKRNRLDRFKYDENISTLLHTKLQNLYILLKNIESTKPIVEIDMTNNPRYNIKTILNDIKI